MAKLTPKFLDDANRPNASYRFMIRLYQLAPSRPKDKGNNTVLKFNNKVIISQYFEKGSSYINVEHANRATYKDSDFNVLIFGIVQSGKHVVVYVDKCGKFTKDLAKSFTFENTTIQSLQFGEAENITPEFEVYDFQQEDQTNDDKKINGGNLVSKCFEIKNCANCKNGCNYRIGTCKTCEVKSDDDMYCNASMIGKTEASIFGYKECSSLTRSKKDLFSQNMGLMKNNSNVHHNTYSVTGAYKALSCSVAGKPMIKKDQYTTVFSVTNNLTASAITGDTLISFKMGS